jgi:hypothetical protein
MIAIGAAAAARSIRGRFRAQGGGIDRLHTAPPPYHPRPLPGALHLQGMRCNLQPTPLQNFAQAEAILMMCSSIKQRIFFSNYFS